MARTPVEQEQEERDERDEEDGQALVGLCTDFFLLGLQIRGGYLELPACETLRRRVLQLFEAMKTRAHKGGAQPNDVEDAHYALAAYLDEMIQGSEWPGREEWASKPLQALLFSESKAGARFFDRLAAVRKRSRAATEVFYHCLVLGFMGEYGVTSPHELDDLIEDLRRELTTGMGKAVSVHGKPPEAMSLGGGSLPLVPLAAGCVLLAVVVIVVLYLLLSSSQNEAVDLLNQMGRG
jgi:type VI secretion system protein ImpK